MNNRKKWKTNEGSTGRWEQKEQK
jgi:hypothetical protein